MAIQHANMTTTSQIVGWEIQSYLGVVSSHLVAGTGLFSEFGAGIADIFGGRSGTFQRQLLSLYAEALGQLQKAASARGGNWVIGLSIDFDEISGKGMQMFMVRATGTAVKAQRIPRRAEMVPVTGRLIQAEDVEVMRRRQEIAERAKDPKCELTESDGQWEFMLEHVVPEALPLVLRSVAASLEPRGAERRDGLIRRAVEYTHTLPPGPTASKLYDALADAKLGAAAAALIKGTPLTRLEAVLAAMGAEDPVPRLALQTLLADQATYNEDDLPRFDALIHLIPERFPDRATPGMSTGIFKGPIWACGFCGEKSNGANTHCVKCHRDACGFFNGEVTPAQAVATLSARRDALAALLEAAADGGRADAV